MQVQVLMLPAWAASSADGSPEGSPALPLAACLQPPWGPLGTAGARLQGEKTELILQVRGIHGRGAGGDHGVLEARG